jgi:heptosyltransferase-2
METLIKNTDNILVIQTAFLGDCILTLPLIEKIRETYTNFKIDVLTTPFAEEIFLSSPFVNEVILFDKKGKHKSLLSLIKLSKELRERNYKKVFSPHRSLRTALLVLLINAEESTGFDRSNLMFAFKKVIKYRYDFHEVQRNLSLIQDITKNETDWKIIPKIEVNQKSKAIINEFFNKLSQQKFIVVAPGSEWFTKRYPIDYYKTIIGHFISKGFIVLLMGGDKDFDLCEQLKINSNSNIKNLAGKFSLIQNSELLKHCKLLITNDSAPTHLGMIANIPVLTIYCSTVPDFGFYPYNDKSSYISLDVYCKPCGIHGYQQCPYAHFNCGNNLKPEMVIEKAEMLLNG